jgi:multiple antibiotic resistance protein
MASGRRRAIAIRACIIALSILSMFGLLGDAVLGFIGISMPAFRIAGGLLLFLTALEMLFGRRNQRRKDQSHGDDDEPVDDPSVFPLAIPLLSGPGGIASMILLTDQARGDIWEMIGIYAAMLVVFAIVIVLFMSAKVIEKALGDTGILVVTRLLGMLLAALSVQFVLDGLAAFGLAGT